MHLVRHGLAHIIRVTSMIVYDLYCTFLRTQELQRGERSWDSLILDFLGFPLFLLLWDHLLVTAYTPAWQSVWRQRETAFLHCWGRLFWQCFCIHMPFYLTKLYRTWYVDLKGLVFCFYTLHPDGCILFCFSFVTIELHPMLIWNTIFPSRSYLTENSVLPFGTCCCCCDGRVQHVTTLWGQNAVLRVKPAGA